MAELILQDGTRLSGCSFGANKNVTGEIVFATGLTGYPESLTDPSYAGQILVLTYPLIGNYGVPQAQPKIQKLRVGQSRTRDSAQAQNLPNNFESTKMQIAGLLVSEYSEKYSHLEATESLSSWLKRSGVPALTGIDTRYLTQKLRAQGTMPGQIQLTSTSQKPRQFTNFLPKKLVPSVSIPKPIFYQAGPKKVALIDCGLKLSILRELLRRHVSVWRLPFDTDLSQYDFDGICLSSGPGDPQQVPGTQAIIRKELKNKKPILGICLGHQILALAAGGKTYKLPYGHRSQNQPVQDLKTKRCFITSQNHGYAVSSPLPRGFALTHKNLNDQSVEGIRSKTKPFFSIQFHPEAQPGPTDTEFLFDEFVTEL